MSNRFHVQTSKLAHNSVKEHKQVFYDKIIYALENMKIGGTSEEIASVAGIEYAQCHKRLPELVSAGKVYNVGVTRPNSSGRQAMVRQLVSFKEKPILIQQELF